MSRVIFIVTGVLLSLLGAIGLMLFGPAIAQVLLALAGRPDQATGPFLDQYRLAAAAAVLMALGATLMGLIAQRDSVKLSVSGKASISLASLLAALGTVAILYGLFLEYRSFQTVAAARNPPTAEDLRFMVASATLSVRGGFGLLVASQILALAGAFQLSPTNQRLTGPTAAKLAGVTYMVMAWMIASLFILIWFLHGRGLAAMTSGSEMPQIVELARHVSGVLIKALLICFCLFFQAACLAAIGLLRFGNESRGCSTRGSRTTHSKLGYREGRSHN